jgi:hypothetical protein
MSPFDFLPGLAQRGSFGFDEVGAVESERPEVGDRHQVRSFGAVLVPALRERHGNAEALAARAAHKERNADATLQRAIQLALTAGKRDSASSMSRSQIAVLLR